MTIAELGTMLNFLIVLIFIYLALSLAASLVVEMVASLLGQRSKMLRARIARMFDDEDETGMAMLLFRSPLLRTYGTGRRLPSYLPADGFARAVIAILRDQNQLTPRDLPPALRALVGASGIRLDAEGLAGLRSELEMWYDQTMARLHGTYKRWARRWLFGAGLVLAVGFNIDFLKITESVWSGRFALDDSVARIAAFHAELAPRVTDEQTVEQLLLADPALQRKIATIVDGTPAPALPIGWVIIDEACATSTDPTKDKLICTPWERLTSMAAALVCPPRWDAMAMVGWLLSALMVLPGTSFWFDALGRTLVLRAAGPRPPEGSDSPAAAPPS